MTTIFLAVLSINIFFIYLIFSFTIYKKKTNENFSIRNHFPFEIKQAKGSPTFFVNMFGLIASILFLANFVFFFFKYTNFLHGVILFSALLAALSMVMVFVFNTYRLRTHCTFGIILIVSSFILNALLINQEIAHFRAIQNPLIFIPMAINVLVAAISGIGLFAPNLFDFSMLKSENGELFRPKTFILALVEWLLIIGLFLTQISLIFFEII